MGRSKNNSTRNGLIVLVIIVLGIIAVSQSGLFSTATINGRTCILAEPEYLTISCEASGNAIPVTVTSSQAGTSFTVNLVEAKIDSVNRPIGDFSVFDSNGNFVCGTQTQSIQSDCTNKILTTGRTYTIYTRCALFCAGDSVLTYSGRELKLKVSIPQIGIDRVPLAGTANCIRQDFTVDAQSSTLRKAIDDSLSVSDKSINLQQGEAKELPRGAYREVTLPTITYNGQPGICSRTDRKILGFTDKESLDGTCYAILDSGNVLKDGSSDPYFACSSSDCQIIYGLSSEYTFVDYSCKKSGQPQNQQCLVNSDCGSRDYITNSDGTTIQRDFLCVNNLCQQQDTQIACNPELSYPNNQCCKKDNSGTWKLEACVTPLKSCDQLGADACCTDKQSEYTLKPAIDFCCDPNNDGIGYNTANEKACYDPGTSGFSLWNLLFGGLGDFLGGLGGLFGSILGIIALIVGIFVIIIIIIAGYKLYKWGKK